MNTFNKPQYKYKKRYNNKQTYKKRYNKRRNFKGYTSVQKQIGFSNRQIATLRYSEQVGINPAAGVVADYVWSANGAYDPNFTGAGHQPCGFDQWMTFYDHYTVLGSKITVTYVSTDPTTVAAGTGIVGIYLMDAATSLSVLSVDELIEQGKSVYTQIGTINSALGVKTLSKNFSAKNFFGTKNIQGQPEYKGGSGSNPNDGAYYHVWAGPTSPIWDMGEVRLTVKIEYITLFSEPRRLDQS